MKTRAIFIILSAAACITCSCSKSKTQTQIPAANLVMYNETSIAGSVSYVTFGKDASGKVISFTDSINDMVYISNLEYGANGKISKSSYIGPTSQPVYAYLYEYDASGHIRKRIPPAGSANAIYGYSTYGYDGAGHLVADSLFSKGGGTTYELTAVWKFKYSGDNVTEIEKYYLNGNTLELDTRKKYEYDNALNPFYALENYFFYSEMGDVFEEARYICRNNVAKEYTATGTGDYQQTMGYSYEYNSNKYPVKCKGYYNPTGYYFASSEFVYK